MILPLCVNTATAAATTANIEERERKKNRRTELQMHPDWVILGKK